MKQYIQGTPILFLMLSLLLSSVSAQGTISGLSIPQDIEVEAGTVGVMPVNFDAGTEDITAVAFSIDFDEALLSYDEAEATFSCVDEASYSCTLLPPDASDTDGELDFVVMSLDPTVGISSGTLINIPLVIDSTVADNTEALVSFSVDPMASYGNSLGQSAPALAPTSGSFLIRRASLNIIFDIEGRTDLDVPLQIALYDLQGNLVSDYVEIASQIGEANITGFMSGTYQVAVKYVNTLQRVETVALGLGTTTVDVGTLLTGDADNDNFVAISDFNVFLPALNTAVGDATYNANADFDVDGFVAVSDFNLFLNNLNVAGEEPVVSP